MDIYDKLKEWFPNCIDGFIGSRCYAIVGGYGLEVPAKSHTNVINHFEARLQMGLIS